MNNRKFPLITIVIPTYDSARTIEKCLLSIKKQTYPNIEIIAIDSLYYDNDNQNRCRRIIKKYARYLQDGPERSIQRNRGIKEARGGLILTIDQDMYLTKDVVKDCYETLKNNNYIALNIPEISIGEGFWTKCVATERYVSNVLEDGMNECCRFFRKKDAIAIGGYDITIVGVEDSDFHYKMQARGRIGKIKSIIYHDEGKTLFFGRIKKKYYYSKAFRKYLKRYPDIAAKQFFPFKKAYIKHWKIFAKNPVITVGIIILRSAEVMAGFLGLILKKE
ncbi:MAG: glycosyltransferase [Patescibacteria group bacterium]